MFRYYFINTIILIYVLALGCTMFTLFVPYLICICIFNVIWQLNALNGFSFLLLINAISAIKKKDFSKKETNYLFVLRDLSYLLLYISDCSLERKVVLIRLSLQYTTWFLPWFPLILQSEQFDASWGKAEPVCRLQLTDSTENHVVYYGHRLRFF